MSADPLTDKIASIAALQEVNAKQLALLLTRDTGKEFKYGPQYDPNATRRFQANLWRMLLLPNSAVPQVFLAPNSVEEITVNHGIGASGSNNLLLKIEMDDNALFKNVPPNGSEKTIFLPPSSILIVGAGTGWSLFWNVRIPCMVKWTRFTLVTTSNVANAWTQGTVLNLGFHGQ